MLSVRCNISSWETKIASIADGIPKRAITQGGSNRSPSAAIRTAPLEFACVRPYSYYTTYNDTRVCGGIRINVADSRRNTNGVNASYTEQYTSPTFRKGMPRNLNRDSCPSPDSDKNECVTGISFSKRNPQQSRCRWFPHRDSALLFTTQ